MVGLDPREVVKPRIVVVSGGFDPLHEGHIRYIEAARKLGTTLVAIVNSDAFITRKRLKQGLPPQPFWSLETRLTVVGALRAVDVVVAAIDEDDTVCATLTALSQHTFLRPHIFANGGDRKEGLVPEDAVCAAHGIELTYGVGGTDKPNSSSTLIAHARMS
jgi:D-beta-D-heptose 7-phosphate kinase/D-beta-D-heptose 1-phosphate adenosyltransferase